MFFLFIIGFNKDCANEEKIDASGDSWMRLKGFPSLGMQGTIVNRMYNN
jgi:hypothetical protein